MKARAINTKKLNKQGERIPLVQTYQLAAIAKMRRKPMKRNDSKLFADTRSVEKIMVRTSWP